MSRAKQQDKCIKWIEFIIGSSKYDIFIMINFTALLGDEI